MKVGVEVEELNNLKYLIERAYNKQVDGDYYEVLDLLFELKERINEILNITEGEINGDSQ